MRKREGRRREGGSDQPTSVASHRMRERKTRSNPMPTRERDQGPPGPLPRGAFWPTCRGERGRDDVAVSRRTRPWRRAGGGGAFIGHHVRARPREEGP